MFWYISIERIWLWLSFWNRRLASLEDKVDDQFVRIFGGERYEIEARRGVSVSGIMKFFISVLIVGWILGFFGTLLELIKS